ncbi:unnamed protein product [Rotaria magnacalcarata]|uniref:ARID domain-containing protein n=11 Tax=Rotaria magnacalcarata TaxID=392030 RepID=A0A814ZVP5_9BILA|nr:unnamed protein product [Rotaria magnacalcarata]CAF1590028.1 unnamed protein product [Rotaria magnacalcarata]CAF2074157.1 unnamed protein product [Rotaria magnacalcarata]CAF2085236.1 unnamed protein product [Rotaria magnacalcarata]CAF2150660.1 unnamed protein product [Rotaria magnacalcarata]
MAASIERDKINHQLVNEIFDRLLKSGIESDRRVFCQRLKAIWQEQSIFCQSHPTITNQILDLYKLYHLVQEKQGYLEITTNRGWKEISNVLGFGDSGSAAYSVKRNYVRLGLLAYECQYDRTGLDPRSVIELSEMPHTVKKRKRGNHSSTLTTHAIVKTNKQQLPMLSNQHEHDDVKKPLTPSIDIHTFSKNSSRYQNLSTSSYRLTPQQMPIDDFQRFPYILRAGCLAESNKYLDTLLVWLSDQHTASYFNLKSLPGLFNAIMEQYTACLYELYGQSFLQPSSTNDYYVNWFLQSNLRINDSNIGPNSNQQRLESLFYGTHRYVLKRLIQKSIKSKFNSNSDVLNQNALLSSSPSELVDTYENSSLFNPGFPSRRRNPVKFYTNDTSTKQILSSREDSMQDNNQQQSSHDQQSQRYHSIMMRCSCLTTIVRNLSFIEENEYLANDRRLSDILKRILNCHHDEAHGIFDYELHSHEQCYDRCSNCLGIVNFDDKQLESSMDSIIQLESVDLSNDFCQKFSKASTDTKIDDPLSCITDDNKQHLMYLLDNTFITLSNLSTFINLRQWYSSTRCQFINTLIHWILCSLSLANEPFISMISEDELPKNSTINNKNKERIYISPRQISLQILAKLCTNEMNVDFILLDLNIEKLRILSHALLSLMNTSNQQDINREYCLIIICSLCKRNQQLVEFFCSHMICIELIFNYLELYECNQQQYLIATLTSCCNATTSSITIPINNIINHSIDMMVDSCIQLLLLFAPIQEKNCLKLFEYKLLNMSSSIYFEQKILKAFANILYMMKV